MILQTLSALALREMIDAGCKSAGLSELNADLGPVVEAVVQRFTDHGVQLEKALAHSSDRSWRALEIALAGEGLFGWLDRADDRVFRQQVRAFLDATPLPVPDGSGGNFRKQALKELREARTGGALGGGSLQGPTAARQAGALARYGDPVARLEADWRAVDEIAGRMEQLQFRSLAHLLRLRPAGTDQPPLIVLAVRFFFRRTIESDPSLFQGMTFSRLQGLAQNQQAGFDALQAALERNQNGLEQMLGLLTDLETQARLAQEDLRRVGDDVRSVRQEQGQQQDRLEEIRNVLARLDVRTEQQRADLSVRQLHDDVLNALEEHRLQMRELRPRDSLSIQNDRERQLVKQLVARYRSLPIEQQNQLPALLNALGRLEVASGDYDAAQRDFQQASVLVHGEAHAEGEVHFNAYRTALERGEWDLALLKFRAAVHLDRCRFTAFPTEKYEPLRILGAGGFGVAFLCRHRFMNVQVVVKSLVREDLGQDINQVFAEAQLLRQLNHPSIIGLQDCGFGDTEGACRPYLVMDYFDGISLEEHIARHGPISPKQLPSLACTIARGLQAAHEQRILHRDVKPANILVRRGGRKESADGNWEVKIIDFGLALPHTGVGSTARQGNTVGKSVLAQSIAGTLDYAAPEQLGKLPGVSASYSADVYGFGRTCAFALFKTPNLSYHDYQELDPALADLLGRCMVEQPDRRLPNFQAVLQRLENLMKPRPVASAKPVEPASPSRVQPESPHRPARPAIPPVPVLNAIPVEDAEEMLTALPVARAVEPACRSSKSRKRRPAETRHQPVIQRNHADVAVQVGKHLIRADCCLWTNLARVFHDGQLMASGWPLIEGTYLFVAHEEGEQVQYEVVVRGPGISWQLRPFFTIRRNEEVVFNDR